MSWCLLRCRALRQVRQAVETSVLESPWAPVQQTPIWLILLLLLLAAKIAEVEEEAGRKGPRREGMNRHPRLTLKSNGANCRPN